ncbi:unnamed protein product [Prorocentrum cordatum]|uniref:Uncharacterized protein n=1 Tax=Prorocentrum cordatum TaxID=2364126 RepID=A0ABN9XR47_9DINO|nr:unnamed protein product [Polarella glacialis]
MPEVVVCDNSMPPWRHPEEGWCDCIVTDPPYGVRAGAKKQGRNSGGRQVEIQDRETYIPSKVGYGEDEMAKDLLVLAASALRDGGRLVFLAPVDLADFLGIDRAAAEHGAAAGGLQPPAAAGRRRPAAMIGGSEVCLGLQLLAPAFVQPRAARAQAEVDPALAGAVAALAALPGEALAEGGKIPGAPLAGSPVCLSKPLVWLIYPLCDLVFLTSPILECPKSQEAEVKTTLGSGDALVFGPN